MGCVHSEDSIFDEAITPGLHTSDAEDKSALRILFFGPGESGKTTIMHQIREINGISHDLSRSQITSNLLRVSVVNYMKILSFQTWRLSNVFNDCQVNQNNILFREFIKMLDYSMAKKVGQKADLNAYIEDYKARYSITDDEKIWTKIVDNIRQQLQSFHNEYNTKLSVDKNEKNCDVDTDDKKQSQSQETSVRNMKEHIADIDEKHSDINDLNSNSVHNLKNHPLSAFLLNEEYLNDTTSNNDNKSKDLNTLLFDTITCSNDSNDKNLNYTKIIFMIVELWNDPGIRKCLRDYRCHYHIDENADYFFNDIDRIFSSTMFVPTFDDILRFRMRTAGFTQEKFDVYFDVNKANLGDNNKTNYNNNENDDNINGDNDDNNTTLNKSTRQKFVFIDVGGQRSERKKWMKMLKDSINAVVYVVAISEFDLACYEDMHTLRLHEAMDLFGQVIDVGFLDNKRTILFFNKNDLFVEKISRVKFSDTFIEYTGDEKNDEEIVEFVFRKFEKIYYERMGNRVYEEKLKNEKEKISSATSKNNYYNKTERNKIKPLHYHRTCALNTDQMASLMSDIQFTVLRDNWENIGLPFGVNQAQTDTTTTTTTTTTMTTKSDNKTQCHAEIYNKKGKQVVTASDAFEAEMLKFSLVNTHSDKISVNTSKVSAGDQLSLKSNAIATSKNQDVESQLSSYITQTNTISIPTSNISSIHFAQKDFYQIQNPLVIVLGIGDYDGMPLIGMKTDYKNMIHVFNQMFGYTMFYRIKKKTQAKNDKTKLQSNSNSTQEKNMIVDGYGGTIQYGLRFKTYWNCDDIKQFVLNGQQLIKQRVLDNDPNQFDSLIFIISCHGSSFGYIHDSEFDDYDLNDIFNAFDNQQCPQLAGKPRLFFVDSCRGSKKSKPYKNPHFKLQTAQTNYNKTQIQNKSNDNMTDHDAKQYAAEEKKNNLDNKEIADNKEMETNIIASNNNHLSSTEWLHKEANFRYIYANIEKYASFDGGKLGGYLIRGIHNAFTKIIKNEMQTNNNMYDLNDIVSEIRRKVSQMTGKVSMQNVQDVTNTNLRIMFSKRSKEN